jgi:hypothetical protein
MTKTASKKKTSKKKAEEKPTFPDTPWGHKQREKAEAVEAPVAEQATTSDAE